MVRLDTGQHVKRMEAGVEARQAVVEQEEGWGRQGQGVEQREGQPQGWRQGSGVIQTGVTAQTQITGVGQFIVVMMLWLVRNFLFDDHRRLRSGVILVIDQVGDGEGPLLGFVLVSEDRSQGKFLDRSWWRGGHWRWFP